MVRDGGGRRRERGEEHASCRVRGGSSGTEGLMGVWACGWVGGSAARAARASSSQCGLLWDTGGGAGCSRSFSKLHGGQSGARAERARRAGG
jgi:hypothetical protein